MNSCKMLKEIRQSVRNTMFKVLIHPRASLVAQTVKESACNAGDGGLIPGSGRFPGEGKATHFNILAWEIPRTEEPGGLQSMGS